MNSSWMNVSTRSLLLADGVCCHASIVGATDQRHHPKQLGWWDRHDGDDTEGVTPRPMSVQAESDLVRHCSDGLPVDALRTQLLSSIRRLMPVDAAFFATADPETLLFTGGYAEDPLRGATASSSPTSSGPRT